MKMLLTLILCAFIAPLGGVPIGHAAEIPIIMYHALVANPENRWEITPAAFESDLKFLTENGYTTVFMQDLIDFVHHGRPLPEKPVVLSFDDGRSPTIDILLPLLEAYNARISMSIVGRFTDEYTEIVDTRGISTYPHMTWDDVRRAFDTGRVEIQSHTYDLHGRRGMGKKADESPESYRSRLLADIDKFAEVLFRNTGLAANTLAYPLGIFDKNSEAILREAGYLATLSCRHKNNTITVGEPDGLFLLNRFLRCPNKPVNSLLS
ncbi:MAG: polysaccharide deacetylase family protein [Clostridiales bacterium]|jgi:peptidoglycan/xylan/chitin deacetylase (PgdA/CDA1 family)|nr:polysaccharide deacetylase family protein [Clostridiales bacterium]